jgi:uncharacterized protein
MNHDRFGRRLEPSSFARFDFYVTSSVAHPLQRLSSQACACSPSTRPGHALVEVAHMAKEDRGFASMDRMKQREIASKGGRAAHVKGTAHEWSAEEARVAGRKGGLASHRKRRPLPVV